VKNQSAGVAQLGNWYAVAAVAAASFGLAAGAHEANAAPVVVHPVGGPVTAPPVTSSLGVIVFNLLDTTGTAFETVPPAIGSPGSLNVAIEWDHSPRSHIAGALVSGRPGVASVLVGNRQTPSHLHYAAKLGGQAAINSSVFGFGAHAREAGLLGESFSGSHSGSWKPGDTGFVGLAVFTSATSQPIFGWAEIHLGSDFDPTLIAWGFNSTPGATDFTPSLPEPSSLLLLASGAAGLAAYRRRRAQRRSAAA
jgi:PEP-CTERM motif